MLKHETQTQHNVLDSNGKGKTIQTLLFVDALALTYIRTPYYRVLEFKIAEQASLDFVLTAKLRC